VVDNHGIKRKSQRLRIIPMNKNRIGIIVSPKLPKNSDSGIGRLFDSGYNHMPHIRWILSQMMALNTHDIIFCGSLAEIKELESVIGSGGKFGLKISYFCTTAPHEMASMLLMLGDRIYNRPLTLTSSTKYWPTDKMASMFNKWALDESGATVFCEDVATVTREMLMSSKYCHEIPAVDYSAALKVSRLPELFLLDRTAIDRLEDIRAHRDAPLNMAILLLSYRMEGELRLISAPPQVEMISAKPKAIIQQCTHCSYYRSASAFDMPWKRDLIEEAKVKGWLDDSWSSADKAEKRTGPANRRVTQEH
jgi:hypothetical protein